MVLFQDIVEALYLPHDDWRIASAIDFIHGRLVGAALVYGAVEVFPGAFDLDVRFIHVPAATQWTLELAEHFLKQRQKPDCPAVDEGMVDMDTAFLHHFLKMAVAKRIGCLLKLTPFHGCIPKSRQLEIAFLWSPASRFIPVVKKLSINAQAA